MNTAAEPAVNSRPADEALRRIRERPTSFDLFQALRLIELSHPHLPRLGDALRPSDEPVRFAQEAALTFAPSAITTLDTSQPPRLVQRVFGLLGPNAALPIHLTEYARERQMYHGDRTFLRFLDMLLHRFGLLFYKAWARSQPVVALDREDTGAFVGQVGSLVGLSEHTRGRDALPNFAKLHFMGRLSRNARDADGLQAWIALRFRIPVEVRQFQPHWMALDPLEYTRLGHAEAAPMGSGAVLGRSVWDVQHKFRIVIGPLDWARYNDFMPGSQALGQLQAMVRQYVGFEFNWDVQLVLRRADVPAWGLGAHPQIGRLGRTAWLNGHADFVRHAQADQLVMNVESVLPVRVTHPSEPVTAATQ